MSSNKFWEKIPFYSYVSEFDVDSRWILRAENDIKAYGSLRIFSAPDLNEMKPGYLRAVCSMVTSRRPKTEEEKRKTLKKYKMEEIELEVYSVDEHIETNELVHEGTWKDLEKLFNVNIFEDD